MRITRTTTIKNEQPTNMILPPPPPPTLEQTSMDDLDGLQPSSLPSPPVSNLETVEPKPQGLNRPPPFPPPDSSSSSTIPCAEVATLTEPTVLFEDLEQFVVNTTRHEETLLTGAAPPSLNALPRSAVAAATSASQIPNAPSVLFCDDEFTFEANDFVLFDDDDDLGPASPPTSPHSLFPSL